MRPYLGYRVQFGASPQFIRDIEKLGGLPTRLYQGLFSVRADTIIRSWGLRGSDSTLREVPSLEGGAAPGQVTQEMVAISILGGFQGSAKVAAHRIPFQAERTDLQRSLPINISVILEHNLFSFFFNFLFLSHFTFKEGGKFGWIGSIKPPPLSTNVTGFFRL